ncbi:hypothetical protein Taro_055022 [Colocasia esculenta]|uniref:glucomannan 4-beta-mannosyltransferase n=1 Tax=Colocasia esculenta TaxID=4460 RepID=A0A843XSY4_COLES|nr:hypothetical protein [Colocasia esculenta]
MELKEVGGTVPLPLLLFFLVLLAGPAAAAALSLPTEVDTGRPLELLLTGIRILSDSAEAFLPGGVGAAWVQIRAAVVAPVLKAAVAVCLAMSVMLVAEVIYLNAVSVAVKLLGRRPERRYRWEPLQSDPEAGSAAYPVVLVQIPMYNEKEELVELECSIWANKGLNINYEVRDNRKGYKAGALKEGLGRSYVRLCEFVAVFDADFQPESDFLMRTIPFLMHNPEVALVQSRWDFVNYQECLMTRIQKMTLDYHFKVEQEAGSSAYAFFGFNGTAGVWRISALIEAGGWKDRTTVEDMDLAVRATLKGWKFVYVGDVKVKSELPSTFKSYRHQQHRWTCGGANLLRKMGTEILTNKEVSLWKKLYVLYNFFIVRKVVCHVLTFVFYCIVIPVTVFFPEVKVPVWGVVYIPTTISVLNAMRNPSSIHIIVFWILFENVMAMHRLRATIIGLLEIGRVNEWVVTEKLGDTAKEARTKEKQPRTRFRDRIYWHELGCSIFLFSCASYDLFYGHNYYYVYIYLQAIAFLVMGFSYVGTNLCHS